MGRNDQPFLVTDSNLYPAQKHHGKTSLSSERRSDVQRGVGRNF